MGLLARLYKSTTSSKRQYRHSVEETQLFLNEFGNPRDDIDRSFFQYKCQKWEPFGIMGKLGKFGFVFADIIALFLLFPRFVRYRIKKVKPVKKKYDAVITLKMLSIILPDDFDGTYIWQDIDSGSLVKEDTVFLRRIVSRHPFSFFFVYKLMCRLANYSEAIRKYSPGIVFSSAEYSFTSSILTLYCESNGVKHYNIMHGEKGYNPRDAFCRFSRFYIWDIHYKELFISLKSDKTTYFIMRKRVPSIIPVVSNTTGTYYLQKQTTEELLKIKRLLDKSGLLYKVRPHPLYKNGDEIEVFGREHVESFDIDIWESIKNAGLIISQDSTVLYEAYLVGAKIVVDDVSDSIWYQELKKRKYIMLDKPHELLSHIIGCNVNTERRNNG